MWALVLKGLDFCLCIHEFLDLSLDHRMLYEALRVNFEISLVVFETQTFFQQLKPYLAFYVEVAVLWVCILYITIILTVN